MPVIDTRTPVAFIFLIAVWSLIIVFLYEAGRSLLTGDKSLPIKAFAIVMIIWSLGQLFRIFAAI